MNAVIYCRVSSKEQLEGTSLESQELACRDFGRQHNLAIARVFVERGESAKFADRTELINLLTYCKDKSRAIDVLLVWKLDRFARNVEDHYQIKAALSRLGVRIVSVTEPIQADPNGKLMETILAGFAQFDNDVRAVRTVQGMQQRLKDGIWPWAPPLGYLPPRIGRKTEPDRPDPRSFEPLRKAWRLFATGAYSKRAILRLLDSWGVRAHKGDSVTPQSLDRMFANPYYAGILRDRWSGQEHSGRHVAMVDLTTFARVQEIVSARKNSQPHHRLTDPFPAKGHVRCPSCEALMTGYFAKGKCRRYPYYKCFRASCPTRTKSYSAASVHDEFAAFLAETSVPGYLAANIVVALVSDHWNAAAELRKAASRRKDTIEQLKTQIQELISLRTAQLIDNDEFVKQRKRLKSQLLQLQAGDLTSQSSSLTDIEVRKIAGVLADLEGAWSSMSPTIKREFGTLLFPAGYVFRRIHGATTGILFNALPRSEADSDSRLQQVFEVSKVGSRDEKEEFRTPDFPRRTWDTTSFWNSKSHLAAPKIETVNAIFAEIRRLLAILRQGKESRKPAA